MSTSLSRFSTLAGSQENTLALAALNFDFSLFKVEAPTEYKALGSCLSDERRRVAEDGTQHITARKLSAIFRGKIPRVPNLIKAYGERVSEIAKITTSEADVAHNYGIRSLFTDKMGIDGTAIWAAATSGSDALCVQLLACMLARFWSAAEATSIWAEILEFRKSELSREGDFDFSEIAAMQANVTREQLAEWDASARAWLRTADAANGKQQTQLRLIIENVEIAVNTTRDTYNSVMEAWTDSMNVIDKLVSGVPQRIYEGAALVGLAAWHLYPDMMVYQPGFKEIRQVDHLIRPGGLLTIGLKASEESANGVRWSLPLASLRYYGDPVVVTKALDSLNSRITFQQLVLVAIGCLARAWSTDMGANYMKVCKYYALLWERTKDYLGSEDVKTWIYYIGSTATAYLKAKDENRKSLKRLIDFGHRRAQSFLNTASGSITTMDVQLLRLADPPSFLSTFKDIDSKLEYLRNLLHKYHPEACPDEWLIVCQYRESYCFATAMPCIGPGMDGTEKPYHLQWTGSVHDSVLEGKVTQQTKMERLRRMTNQCGWLIKLEKAGMRLCLWVLPSTDFSKDELPWRYLKMDVVEGTYTQVFLDLAYGHPNAAALYKKSHVVVEIPPERPQEANFKRSNEYQDLALPPRIPVDDILSALADDKISIQKTQFLADPTADCGAWYPLQVLGLVGRVYESLSCASMSMDVTSSALISMRWCSNLQAPQKVWGSPEAVTLGTVLSCIAIMETGDQDLDPTVLAPVMAMSVGDSIYAASLLVSDPHEDRDKVEVIRALGNIGKPGISLLIPPANPSIRKPRSDEWNVINHDIWDGKPQNSFEGTSLHLSLTDYRVPYASKHEGARDLQAFFQEAVVSIYDRNFWVGDVDILKVSCYAEGGESFKVNSYCPHHHLLNRFNGSRGPKTATSGLPQPTAIDNWYELLDKPENPTVVRCYGDWVARLATASLSRQLGYRTIILPDRGCDNGCFSDVEFMTVRLEDGDVIIW